MAKTWEQETAEMLKIINDETEKLLHANLPTEEFHKKHEELMRFWNETSKKIQQNHPMNLKPKARPKHHHQSHHMTDKFFLNKMLKQLYKDN